MKNANKLDEKAIHIWRVYLPYFYSAINAPNSHLILLLSDREQQRANRFLFDKHRYPYIVAQTHLRIILSYYLQDNPASLIFDFGTYGKPFIEASNLKFNMSHSKDYAFYALMLEHEVGIDVEFHRERIYAQEIVKSQFSEFEYTQYRQLPSSQKVASFYKGWVCKEAYIKAIGMGLAFPLRDFSVDMDPNKPGKLVEIKDSRGQEADWYLHLIESPQSYSSAVASHLINPNIEYFDIP